MTKRSKELKGFSFIGFARSQVNNQGDQRGTKGRKGLSLEH